MGVDHSDEVVAAAKTALEGVTDIGAVYSFVPAWQGADDMDQNGGLDIYTDSDGKKEHRFWFIEDDVDASIAATNQSQDVIHNLTITGFIAAKDQGDFYEASLARARDLRRNAMAAFEQPHVAFPSIDGQQLDYEDTDAPVQSGSMDFIELFGVLFHRVAFTLSPREEVTHG